MASVGNGAISSINDRGLIGSLLFFEKFLFLSYFCGFLDSPRAFLQRILKFLCAAHVFCRESAFRAPFHLNDLFKGKKLII